MTLTAQEQAEQLWSDLDSLDNDAAAARLLPLIERAARYDEIETNIEAALGEAEEKLRRVLAVCDDLDKRYLTGDGKPLTSERQIGKCAGYSLAAHLIRQAIQ